MHAIINTDKKEFVNNRVLAKLESIPLSKVKKDILTEYIKNYSNYKIIEALDFLTNLEIILSEKVNNEQLALLITLKTLLNDELNILESSRNYFADSIISTLGNDSNWYNSLYLVNNTLKVSSYREEDNSYFNLHDSLSGLSQYLEEKKLIDFNIIQYCFVDNTDSFSSNDIDQIVNNHKNFLEHITSIKDPILLMICFKNYSTKLQNYNSFITDNHKPDLLNELLSSLLFKLEELVDKEYILKENYKLFFSFLYSIPRDAFIYSDNKFKIITNTINHYFGIVRNNLAKCENSYLDKELFQSLDFCSDLLCMKDSPIKAFTSIINILRFISTPLINVDTSFPINESIKGSSHKTNKLHQYWCNHVYDSLTDKCPVDINWFSAKLTSINNKYFKDNIELSRKAAEGLVQAFSNKLKHNNNVFKEQDPRWRNLYLTCLSTLNNNYNGKIHKLLYNYMEFESHTDNKKLAKKLEKMYKHNNGDNKSDYGKIKEIIWRIFLYHNSTLTNPVKVDEEQGELFYHRYIDS